MLFKSKPSSVRLRDLIAELQSAEKDLQTDPNVEAADLRELRHALDNLRLTAWTVSELQNARTANKDTRAIASFLTAERLRRLRRMIDDLCADLEHDPAAWPKDSINDLQESLRVLHERLLASAYAPRKSGK
jgi:hypothetical protein